MSRLAKHPLSVEYDFDPVKLVLPYLVSGANTTPYYKSAVTDVANMAFSFWVRVLDTNQTDHIGLGMFSRSGGIGQSNLALSLGLKYNGSSFDLQLDFANISPFSAVEHSLSAININDGSWHWIAAVANGNSITIHVDAHKATFTATNLQPFEHFMLGRMYGHGSVADEYASAVEYCDIRVHADNTNPIDFSGYWNHTKFTGFTGTTFTTMDAGFNVVSSPAGSDLVWQGTSLYAPTSMTYGFATSNLRGYLAGFNDAFTNVEQNTPGLHPIGHNVAYASGSALTGYTDTRTSLVEPNLTPHITASGNSMSIPATERGVLDSTSQFDRETNYLLNGFVRRSY